MIIYLLAEPHKTPGLTRVLYWTHLPVTTARSSSVAPLLGHDDVSGNDDVISSRRCDVRNSGAIAPRVKQARSAVFMVR